MTTTDARKRNHDREDQAMNDLKAIREEAVTTSNVLADILDLLDERLTSNPRGRPGDLSASEAEPAPDSGGDPDEALRAALNQEIVRQSKSGEVEIVVHNGYGLEAGLARVAREHINGGMDICIVNEWKSRHEALRADVVEVARRNGPTIADRMVADRLDGILDRDDERGGERDA